MPERAIPTTRASGKPVMFMQEMPVHRHGEASESLQSEKAEVDRSTADLRERRERPSGVRDVERSMKHERKKSKKKRDCFIIEMGRRRRVN